MPEERRLTIKKDHPALPGHFPGNPVVPGVIILEEVLETLLQSEPTMISIVGAPVIKFHAPLRPDEEMTIRLEPYPPQGKTFICTTGSKLIATGLVTYQTANRSEGNQK
jgi:3-hydroxyacyl-[acyl-carrier-protein] dehydratase